MYGSRIVPTVTPRDGNRGIRLLRAALPTALVGHWIANALFDREQYAGLSPRVLQHLNDPLLIQGLFTALAVAGLTVWLRSRFRGGTASLLAGSRTLRAIGVLLVAQLCVFVAMEATERLALAALYPEAAEVGVFGEGFLAELAVAVGTALGLSFVGAATVRVVRILRGSRAAPRSDRRPWVVVGDFFRPPLVLRGTGSVRAPPFASS